MAIPWQSSGMAICIFFGEFFGEFSSIFRGS